MASGAGAFHQTTRRYGPKIQAAVAFVLTGHALVFSYNCINACDADKIIILTFEAGVIPNTVPLCVANISPELHKETVQVQKGEILQ